MQSIIVSNNNNSWPIQEFNGEEYDYWRIKMRTLIIGNRFWDVMEEGYNEPVNWSSLPTNER